MTQAVAVQSGGMPVSLGAVPSIFAKDEIKNKLGAGIEASYAIVGYKGKVWSIRYRGDELKLVDTNRDPIPSIEAILVESSEHRSKIFYEGGYQEGNQAPPDCFSNDGIVPDPNVPKRQNPVCATCPKNMWGSAVNSATGGKGKACGDFKRVAIVPAQDPENALYGGPMLLRIPAASLQDAASYSERMAKYGYNTYMIVTRIGFDVNESYPKMTFKEVRVLTEAEGKAVLDHQKSQIIKRVLGETAEVAAAPTQVAGPQFEQTPPAVVVPAQTVVNNAPTQVAQAAAPVQVTPEVTPAPVQEAKPSPFGGVAVASTPAPATATPAQVATSVSAPVEVSAGAAAFEAELEARINSLMPPAA